MLSFEIAISASPPALSSILWSTNRGMGQSATVFVVMVTLAGIGCLLALIGLAGGLRGVLRLMPKSVSVDSVAFVVLLVAIVLLVGLMFHRRRAKMPARARVVLHEPVHHGAEKSSPTAAQAPIGKVVAGNTNSGGGAAQPAKPAALPANSLPVTPTPPASAPAPKVEQPPEQIAEAKPTIARLPRSDAPEPARPSRSLVVAPAKKASIVIRGAKVLSDAQAKLICGEVSPFSGAQVYIKWSPGANAEHLAGQLSQVMDCARVTVTYASETSGGQGHGVSVGTHANEGETSERIRPFADAITAALRAQGFSVSEVTGANIPANQTAIFIGSD